MNTLIALGTGTAFVVSALATAVPELFHAGGHAPVYYEAAVVIWSGRADPDGNALMLHHRYAPRITAD